jgi:hypothetical protein
MKKMTWMALMVTAAWVHTATAGWYFESKADTTSDGESEGGAFAHDAKTWLDGDNLRMEFTRSDNPVMPAGSYLLSRDQGKNLLLVNPEAKTYSPFNPGEFASSMMNMMGGMMQFKNARVEKVADEDAGEMLGQAVRRYQFNTSYDMEMNIFGMRQSSRYESTQEIWAAPGITASHFDIFGGADALPISDASFKEEVKSVMAEVKGLPMKQVITTKTTDLTGKVSEDSSTITITTLREEKMPAAMFELPADYKEVPFLAAIAGAAGVSEENMPEDMPAFDPAALMEMMKQFQPPGE